MEDTKKNTIVITATSECGTDTFTITPVGYDEEKERFIVKCNHVDFIGYEQTEYLTANGSMREVRNAYTDILDTLLTDWRNAHNV